MRVMNERKVRKGKIPFFKNKLEFKVTGAYGQTKEVQLRNFADELNRRSGKEWANPKDWIQAFNYLREYIEELSDDEKHVFFIDEMPWLDTHKSGFMPAFEYFCMEPIIAGYMMYKHPPKEINGVIGYRTTRSRKNIDTWKFAHDYCGRLWLKAGFVLLIPTIIAQIPFVKSSDSTIG